MPLIDEKIDSLASARSLYLDRALKEPTLYKVAKSPITLGIILLLLLNALLWITQPLSKVDPQILPATHTWTWWATQEFLQEKPAPPVVLLGSSLFMHAVSREDADYLNTDFDYVHHHYSQYLADRLKDRFGKSNNLTCFNFALPGDLVSDDYMVARALFHGEHKPKYVILGLSLRDFIDNAVNCPGTTPPFRYLKRFTNIEDLIDLALPKWWQQLDYRTGQIFYLWDKKLELQVCIEQAAKKLLAPVVASIGVPSLLNDLDYRKHVPSNLHSEVEEGMAIIKAHQPYSFDPNYADYRRRCGSANEGMFKIQAGFLTKLVDLCKQEKIELIILNMPLTKGNVAIMPNGSYEHYLNTIQQISKGNSCVFMDLNGDPRFVDHDFYDSAHMNSAGGKKMLDVLANLNCLHL